MNIIVLEGDARMAALAALLRREGWNARHVATIAEAQARIPFAEAIVTPCPPKLAITLDEVLSLAPSEARVYLCGPAAYAGDSRVIDLWQDEELKLENAQLTAEGAVSAAMRAGRRCLRELPCAVIGWGRIGGALTEILVALGARVTVASRSQAHRHRAIERGAEAVCPESLPRLLPEVRLIFNTAPAPILDAPLLERVNREAMVIDLASPPYGVDLTAAWRQGLRAWREPGLPGRYCPESAAAALFRAMQRGDAR